MDGTYNINTNSQPGRLFPDAVNFVVTEVGAAQVVVRGGVGGLEIGDEVLLINLQGDATNHGNVGNYEIKEVARINYGQNTVFFTTSLTKIYGATDSNADITGQKIMLQRAALSKPDRQWHPHRRCLERREGRCDVCESPGER